jgi:hypothetical protein
MKEEQEKKSEKKTSGYEIIPIDKRLSNIEKGLDTIEKVALNALEMWSKNQKTKQKDK